MKSLTSLPNKKQWSSVSNPNRFVVTAVQQLQKLMGQERVTSKKGELSSSKHLIKSPSSAQQSLWPGLMRTP